MDRLIKFFVLSATTLFLSSCDKSYTHEYLLQHPETIQTELAKCREAPTYTSYCDMVKHTSDEFSALVDMRNENQEAFGRQILQVEMDIATTKKSLEIAQKNYEMLKAKNPDDPNLKKAQQDLNQTIQSYNVKKQQLQTLFAVIAVTSSSEL